MLLFCFFFFFLQYLGSFLGFFYSLLIQGIGDDSLFCKLPGMFSRPFSSSSSSSSFGCGFFFFFFLIFLFLDDCSITCLFFLFFYNGQTTSFWPLWVQNNFVWISDFKPNPNNAILVRFKITYPNDIVLEPKRPK